MEVSYGERGTSVRRGRAVSERGDAAGVGGGQVGRSDELLRRALQVVTPTYLIFTAHGDTDTILSASGLYLFAFTYLYVGLNLTFGLDSTGLGYFCAFVVVCALVFSGLNFGRLHDSGFGVVWLYWAFLWALFFLVLGLKREHLTRYTGAVCAIQGLVTATVPAFLLLTGHWHGNRNVAAIVLAVFGVVVFTALYPILRSAAPTPEVQAVGAR